MIHPATESLIHSIFDEVVRLDPSFDHAIFHLVRGSFSLTFLVLCASNLLCAKIDFQFKATLIDATAIYQNVKDKMREGATVYIATDERDKKFFDPLKMHYNVLFLDDFKTELKGVNTNHFGMIDQLVASRGRLFFGCWHST